MNTSFDPPIFRPFAIFTGVFALAITGLILSIVLFFILGFFENDPQFSALLPAVILCLCVSAVFIVPTLLSARLAWKTLKGTASRSSGFWASVFNIPILILSGFIFTTQSLHVLYALGIAVTALIFLAFGVYILRKHDALEDEPLARDT